MNVSELYKKLDELIPRSLSCDWDHDGLEVCPEPEKEVNRVLISLDVTDDTIEKALEENFDLIVAHHPLFFRGLENVSALNCSGKRAVRLIKGNVSVATFHTRLDALSGGVNDCLASLLGLEEVGTVENNGEAIMRIGNLAREMKAVDFAAFVREKLNAPAAELIGCGKNVKRVAVLGGSGGDDLISAAQAGADTYLTGELKYHEKLMSGELGINIVCGGHFFTEFPVCRMLEKTIGGLCPNVYAEIFFSNKTEIV